MKKILLISSIFFFTMAMKLISQNDLNLLVFTKTTDYYHEATPNAVKAFYNIAKENQWGITITKEATLFRDEILNNYDVVVFLLTGGDVFNNEQKLVFQRFIEAGGGFVGVHSATTTEYDWPWFGNLVGAYFTAHPPVQSGKLIIENKNHPSTRHFAEDSLTWKDEWYSFDKNPREQVEVLMSIDESSYNIDDNPWFEGADLRMDDHPIAWCREYDGGRSFQTALGHLPEHYDQQVFRKHLIGGVIWAAKRK